MKLYHGSYLKIENPLAGIGRKSLDFGQGFYLTSIRQQGSSNIKRLITSCVY